MRGLVVGLYQLASPLNLSSFLYIISLMFPTRFFFETVSIGALLSAIVLNATQNRPNHSAWRVCCFITVSSLAKDIITPGPSPQLMICITSVMITVKH